MTITEIDLLTLDKTFFIVLYRMLDFSAIDNGLPVYTVGPDESLSMFDRVVTNVQSPKPLLQDMEAELVVYKQELTDRENARLAEVARVEALELRIVPLRESFHSLLVLANIPNIPNSAVEFKRIVVEDDTATLSALEAVLSQHLSKVASVEARRLLKEEGAKAKKVCDDCLDIVRGFNKNRTDAQVLDMKTVFANVFMELNYGSSALAKNLIVGLVVDAELSPLKESLLEEFAEHGY